MAARPPKTLLLLPLLYIVVGGCWVLGADFLMGRFFSIGMTSRLSIFNGLAVVTATAGVLYLVARRSWNRLATVANRATEAEERWRLALACTRDGVWDRDLVAGTCWWSQRWREIMGLNEADLKNSSEDWLQRIHPDDLPRVLQLVDDHVHGHTTGFSSVHRMRHGDGRYRYMHDRGIAIRDRRGIAVRLVGAVTDISLRRMREEADGALRDLNEAVLLESPVEEELRKLCERISQVFDLPLTWVGIRRDDGRVDPVAVGGLTISEVGHITVRWDNTPEGQGSVGRAIRTGHPHVLPMNDSAFTEVSAWRGIIDQLSLSLAASFPLQVSGSVVGALTVYARSPGIGPFELHIIESLARGVAVAYAASLNREQLRLQDAALSSAVNAVYITDHDGRIIWANSAFERMSGYETSEVIGRMPASLRSDAGGNAYHEQVWDTVRRGEHYAGDFTDRRKDGTSMTVFESITPVPGPDGRPTHFISIQEDITARKQAEAQLVYLARHDTLTGLANRTSFAEKLDQALVDSQRDGRSFSLLLLDLDRFKYVNDTLGHDTGDRLLQAVAMRLRGQVHANDIVARLGGDEFAILQRHCRHPEDAAALALRLNQAFATPFRTDETELRITASIGITVHPGDAADGAQLLKNADLAMYRAKHEGRDGYQFFTTGMQEEATRRATIEEGLRLAIESSDEQLVLYFQPLVDLTTHRVTGAEALIRWNHPTRGLLGPDAFLDVAEETGLIRPLGDWAMRKACSDFGQYQLPDDFRLSINLSAAQFSQDSLPETVAEALADSGLHPQHVEFEITETTLAGDMDRATQIMAALRLLGVSIAIDDFGTGYSSLTYLRRFPLDRLKIDREFIRDLQAGAAAEGIIRATISLATSLNLKVVAEGVESLEQCQWLHQQGCQEAQGFYFGPPMPFEQFLNSVLKPLHHPDASHTLPEIVPFEG